jgi:hypothetical protein
MARVTAAEYADKWSRRLKQATPDIQAGIKRVQVAPGVAAAQQQAAMLQNLTAAVSSGVWARRVASVSVQDWQNAALNKGVARITAGVDAATPKVAANAQALLAAVDGAVQATNMHPRGDIESNINRAVTFMREMAKRAPKRQK